MYGSLQDSFKFVKYTGKHGCRGLFLKKLMLATCNVTEKETEYRCFPVHFGKFFETVFMQNTFNRATTSVNFVYANTAKCRSSRPEVFLEISQISQENTCARVSF